MLHIGYAYLLQYLHKTGDALVFTPSEPVSQVPSIEVDRLCKAFFLTKSEQMLVILTALDQTNTQFHQIFEELGGFSLSLISAIFQTNESQPFCIRYEYLSTFLFAQLAPHQLTLQPYVVLFLQKWDMPPSLPIACSTHVNFYALAQQQGRYVFVGPYGIGRKRCFVSLCATQKRPPFFVTSPEHACTQAFRAIAYEGALCITDADLLDLVQAYLPFLPLVVVIAGQPVRGLTPVTFAPLTYAQRREIWAKQPEIPSDLHDFASNYVFSSKEITEITREALQECTLSQTACITQSILTRTMHRKLQQKGHHTFQQNTTNYRLADVILPAKQKKTLQEAVSQVKNRAKVHDVYQIADKMQYGTGLSILLVGPAGTGKTMTAHAFANELHALLYKIDLSMIVSKFIGETEKNLKKIFEQARNTQAMLFFDEADALFAKRTEVKDANDKYSNMEAAFLLQEIENYQGTTLLATNFLQNIDDSFKRRMKFIVEFPYPTATERLQILQESLPAQLPCSDALDLPFIAQNFELTGANIKNIVYNAAFLAVENGDLLDMTCLLRAVCTEFAKMGKQLRPHDFGVYATLLEDDA